jgi:rubrerythrin
MDLGSLFLILALLFLVGLFVSRPFFERQEVTQDPMPESKEHARSVLLAERDRILNALQELDFDHVLGKIPEEDYPQQRAVLVQHGADILRKLDDFQAEPLKGDAEAQLEAAIVARRANMEDQRVVTPASTGNGRKLAAAISAEIAAPDDDLEVMLANRRRVRQEKAAGFCPKCGKPVQKSDLFCPKCGAKIA